MDIKDIIKWFIPSVLMLCDLKKIKVTVCLFLFLSGAAAMDARPSDANRTKIEFIQNVNDILNGWTSGIENATELLGDFNKRHNVLSDLIPFNYTKKETAFADVSGMVNKDMGVARTFGRPLKKLSMALIPLAFQVGAASTWMMISALVSFKGLLVGLLILKLLLLGGAAKVGTLFAHKVHAPPHQPWTPQKEVHLHIHGAHPPETHESHTFDEHGGPWSRDGPASQILLNGAPAAPHEPYPGHPGPQTINTPYGSYVRVGPGLPSATTRRR